MGNSQKSLRKPTLKDVARIAGVSISTASTALSNPSKLRESTLDRVMRVINQIGYIPNGAAQALVRQTNRTLAVVVPTIDNPMYSTLLASIQNVVKSSQYHLLIGSHEFDFDVEHDVVCSLIEKGIDGLILIGSDHEDRTFALLRARSIPFVLAVAHDEHGQLHTVGFSNREASAAMARLVYDMGHRRVALCGGYIQSNERARQRYESALEVFKSNGVDVPDYWRIQRPISILGGRETFRHLWALEKRPSVLIFSTDVQAIGALDEARLYKVKVPEELSITGFDDIEYAALCNPPLTTVQVPIKEIGLRAVQHLLDLLVGNKPIRCELLPTSVSLRASLAAPSSYL